MKQVQKAGLLLGAVAVLFFSSGCMGSFGLTKKVYQFNEKLSGNKIVNGIVFILLLPDLYPICLFADTFILNVIESLTGDKLISMKAGEREDHLVKIEDKNYRISCMKDAMVIKQLDGADAGKTSTIVYHEQSNQWFVVQDGVTTKVAEGDQLLPALQDLN